MLKSALTALGVILFFSFVCPVFAALTITDTSPLTINSAEDIVTISASASGLQGQQYLQAVFTKKDETTDYLGFSQNLFGEWYQYKSSPVTSDFSSYFFSFTPVSGTWSGQLKAKIDTADSGFKGPGDYLLKLAKYVTSSSPTYSNTVNLAVNVSLPSGNSPTNQEVVSAPTPKIDWTLEDKIYVAKEFKTIKLELSNFDANTEYFLKLRAGTEEGKLTKIQTKNGSAFLSDGEVWSKFPLIKTDANAKWTGEIKGLLGEGKQDGKYKILLRIRKKDTDTYLESDVKEITFLPEIIETTAVVTPSAAIVIKPKVVLAASTTAVINLATPTPTLDPTPLPTPIPTKSYLSEILMIIGVTLILLAIIALWKLSPELFTKLKIWEQN